MQKFIIIILVIFLSSAALHAAKVKLGIDLLEESRFKQLKNKNILLYCNFASRNSKGEATFDLFLKQKSFELKGLLTPEHGYYTTVPAGEKVANDKLSGIAVYSLYNFNNKENENSFKEIDVIVVDIQEIGIRSYTYISTLIDIMQSAAKKDIEVLILDRPNPLGGLIVDGGVAEEKFKSIVSKLPVSYLHGMTIAELAKMANQENWVFDDRKNKNPKCKLKIIEMKNWERWMVWEDTELEWFATSPHIPTVDAVRGAAVLGVWGELGFISIGIGTTLPFQYLAHKSFALDDLNPISFDGMKLEKTRFRPLYALYSGENLNGYLLKFSLSNDFRPYSSGFEIMLKLKKKYPALFDAAKIQSKSKDMFNKVCGTDKIYQNFFEKFNEKELRKNINAGLNDFIKLRSKYLLY